MIVESDPTVYVWFCWAFLLEIKGTLPLKYNLKLVLHPTWSQERNKVLFMLTVRHPVVFVDISECLRCLKMQLTSWCPFMSLENELPRGDTLSMSIWDKLRKTQNASFLFYGCFLSLQSYHHGARGWRSFWVSKVWVTKYNGEQSVDVNTESNAVTLLHSRAEKEKAWGDEELL